LVHEYATSHGKKRLWTTFSEDQIDLDYHNPDVLVELIDVLLYYAYHGAAMIRLDAIGYIWKESGTSCINLPGAHAIVRLIRLVYKMAAPHVLVLTETNVPHRENVAYFGNGTNEAHIVYNFTLSPLILHALLAGNAEVLTGWAASVDAPPAGTTFLNFTASHDGIGVRPTEGILDDAQRAYLCELTRRHGGRIGYKRESDGTDTPYELNITYFDAINDPCADESLQHQVRRFMVSQAIMLAFRGIPALYIHSLFGTRNAHEEVARTGIARSINRAQRDYEDLSRLLTTPHTREYLVYRGMKRLLDARKRVPAFHPDATQRVHRLHERVFALQRTHPYNGHTVLALHNVSSETVSVDAARVPAAFARCRDVFTARTVVPHKDGGVILPPYGISWLAAGE
jgi:sucrose phosphorylase